MNGALPVAVRSGPGWGRLRDVMAITGWPEKYVRQLREEKVIKTFRCKRSRYWYNLHQIRKLMEG
jgi:hypothetical protein